MAPAIFISLVNLLDAFISDLSKACPGTCKEASNTPAKGMFDMTMTACEAVDGESWWVGGGSIGQASRLSGGALPSEKTRLLTRGAWKCTSEAGRSARARSQLDQLAASTTAVSSAKRTAALPPTERPFSPVRSLLRRVVGGRVWGTGEEFGAQYLLIGRSLGPSIC